MTSSNPSLIELIDRYFDLPPSEKSSFLKSISEANPTMYKQLRSVINCDWLGSDLTVYQRATVELVDGSAAPVFEKGDVIGDYEITGFIGQGGMSTVYKATNPKIEMDVALKFFSPLLVNTVGKKPLLFEGTALAKLNNPNICQVLTVGEFDDLVYLVTEFIDATSLSEKVALETLQEEEFKTLVLMLCNAVQHTHSIGIIHGDIKPSNILIQKDGNLKLIDFGVSMLSAEAQEQIKSNLEFIRGYSALYCSPEQQEFGQLTTASDVYSIGKVISFLLSDSQYKTPELQAIIAKSTCQVSEERYQTVDELKNELTRAFSNKPVHSYSRRFSYRLQKWFIRKPLLASTYFVGLVTVFTFLSVYLVQRETIIDEQQRKLELADFVTSIYESVDPEILKPGEKVSALQLLESSIDSIKEGTIKSDRLHNEVVNHVAYSLISISEFELSDEVLSFYRCDESICEQSKEFPGYVRAKCQLYYLTPNYLEAVKYCDRASSKLTKLNQKFAMTGNLLLSQYMLGNLKEAEQAGKRILDISIQSNNPEFKAESYYYFSELKIAKGDYQGAIIDLDVSIALLRKVSPNHFELANYISTAGYAYEMLGDYISAEKALLEAAELQVLRFGHNHHKTSTVKYYLASLYDSKGDYQKSIELYEEVIETELKIFGNNSLRVANSKTNLSTVFLNIKEFKNALELLNEAEEIHKAIGGEDQSGVLNNNYGSVYFGLKDYPKALEYYSRALKQVKSKQAKDIYTEVVLMKNIGLCHYHSESYQKSLTYFEGGLKLAEATFPFEHFLVTGLKKDLENTRLKLSSI